MRKMFPGYYCPTEEEFTSLWNDCLFVLDANILLNLYRYTIETSNKLLEILKAISGRLWVPHQAAQEYQRNRLKVIADQIKAYNAIRGNLDTKKEELDKILDQYKRHPLINVDQWRRSINMLFSRIKKQLKAQEAKHPDLLKDDNLRQDITSAFRG